MSIVHGIESQIALQSMQMSGEPNFCTFSHGLDACSIGESNKIAVDKRYLH